MRFLRPDQTVLHLLEARQEGDVRRMLGLLHPDADADWLLDERGSHRRREIDVHRLVVDGDVVKVVGRLRVFDRGSLADSPACWRFTVADGLVRHVEVVPLHPASRAA